MMNVCAKLSEESASRGVGLRVNGRADKSSLTHITALTDYRRQNVMQTMSRRTYFITALHEIQTRSSDENSVRQSVCLSVKRVHCDKTKEKSVEIFIPCERSFSLFF